jgi:hypothetical protein
MHSAQHFYFDSYRSARYHSFSEDSGLPTPISPKPSRAPTPSESDLDLASETDDNTLDKGWLNEMRTSIREIKDLKGMRLVNLRSQKYKGSCYIVGQEPKNR